MKNFLIIKQLEEANFVEINNKKFKKVREWTHFSLIISSNNVS